MSKFIETTTKQQQKKMLDKQNKSSNQLLEMNSNSINCQSPPPSRTAMQTGAKMLVLYITISTVMIGAVLGQTFGNGLESYEDNVNLRSRISDQTRSELATILLNQYNHNPDTRINKPFGEKLLYYIKSAMNDKNKRDDDVPPGFIGVRGRRSGPETEVDNVLDRVNSKPQINKRSSSVAYKDGFLGVRGK